MSIISRSPAARAETSNNKDTSLRPARTVYRSDGTCVSPHDLPRPTDRWIGVRKEVVVVAVMGGLITFQDASGRYRLSEDEFLRWRELMKLEGRPGLKAGRELRVPRIDTGVKIFSLPKEHEIRIGDVLLKRQEFSVVSDHGRAHITFTLQQVLLLLHAMKGKVLTRQMIFDYLYALKKEKRKDKIIESFILKLRNILRDVESRNRIERVWGRGYYLALPE